MVEVSSVSPSSDSRAPQMPRKLPQKRYFAPSSSMKNGSIEFRQPISLLMNSLPWLIQGPSGVSASATPMPQSSMPPHEESE